MSEENLIDGFLEPATPGEGPLIETSNENVIEWPLSYRIQLPKGRPRCWSHDLYRGPKNETVKVIYSKTKAKSEALAKLFLNESIIGFDMEWPWDSDRKHRLQDKVGLIQIASLDRVALIHIGLHDGRTTDDLIAPSLRKLIESPNIIKTGVAVWQADMLRLRRWFKLKPQAAFELSHLHNLVTFGASKPESVTKSMVGLARLVDIHLGLPLKKGKVRTSNWSEALNAEQIKYAADDAYCGLMLFHCMNAKRGAMDSVPPLPILADKYPRGKSGLLLEPPREGGTLTAYDFFGVKIVEKVKTGDTANTADQTGKASKKQKNKKERKKEQSKTERFDPTTFDPITKTVFDLLWNRRKVLAESAGVSLYRIASNSVLAGLARQRPLDYESLLLVKGIGQGQQEKYGPAWLEVIHLFRHSMPELKDVGARQNAESEGQGTQVLQQPPTPKHKRGRRRSKLHPEHEGPSSSPAFGTPPHRTPQLHTQSSSTLAETKLDSGDEGEPQESADWNIENSVDDMFDSGNRRKRPKSPAVKHKRRSLESVPPQPLTPRTRILRSKIEAYSKRIAGMMRPRPAEPLVSAATLDLIVIILPQTVDELRRIPGISKLAEACTALDKDLLGSIMKFVAARN